MKNIWLHANYCGGDKILVDMSNYVYDVSYGKTNQICDRRFIAAHHKHYIRFKISLYI